MNRSQRQNRKMPIVVNTIGSALYCRCTVKKPDKARRMMAKGSVIEKNRAKPNHTLVERGASKSLS